MPRTYVHISSLDRDHDNEPNSDKFRINLQTPITNCDRVCVASFSIPNTFHNITKHNNTFYWLENKVVPGVYSPFTTKLMKATIPIGYYDIYRLMSAVQNAVNLTLIDSTGQSRQYDQETLPFWVISLESDTYVKITASSGSDPLSQKYWMPFVKDGKQLSNSIWHGIFGFEANQIKIKTDQILPNSLKKKTTQEIGDNELDRSIVANHTYVENTPGIIIASQELANNTYATHKSNGSFTIANKVNYLQHINIHVNRYSYIHYERSTEMIGWHDMNGKDVSSFDIQILDKNGNTLDHNIDALPEFQMVLCFEQHDNHDTDQEIMVKAYDREAYRLEHYGR